MKQFLIGGSVVLATLTLMGSTFNRGNEVPMIVAAPALLQVPPGGFSGDAPGKTVSCPAGKYAFSSGFITYGQDEHHNRIDIIRSSPTNDLKSWNFLFYNPTSNTVEVRVLAICM